MSLFILQIRKTNTKHEIQPASGYTLIQFVRCWGLCCCLVYLCVFYCFYFLIWTWARAGGYKKSYYPLKPLKVDFLLKKILQFFHFDILVIKLFMRFGVNHHVSGPLIGIFFMSYRNFFISYGKCNWREIILSSVQMTFLTR